MPVLNIQTNVPQANVPVELVQELSRVVAQLLHKPETYVVIHIQGDQMISFGGSSSPCAYATLKSIGGLGGKRNNEHAKTIYNLVERFLGVQGDRMYLEFIDVSATEMAYNGRTFA